MKFYTMIVQITNYESLTGAHSAKVLNYHKNIILGTFYSIKVGTTNYVMFMSINYLTYAFLKR